METSDESHLNGPITSMIEFKGTLYVATSNKVYRFDGERLIPIEFVTLPPTTEQ